MVYLLDPNSGTAMSVDHQFLAQSIAERYPNIRLSQVPMNERSAREEFPFALTDAVTREVIKPLRESECNISFVYKWLYEHDTQARGVKEVYAKYQADKERMRLERERPKKEELMQNLDVVNTMARSEKHYFKHGDRKFGS